MIDFQAVTKYYGDNKALSDISLSIEDGEAVALLGPNGAGKSTLIKCLLGLLDYTGEISVNGVDVRNKSKLAKSFMAYVPQESAFYDMKTTDVLGFYQSLRKADKKRIDEILETVGLTEHRHKSTSELSGGMKQRLAFAVALIADCPVLVLDEPTSNLDKDSRAELLELTRTLKKSGKTVVFSSHRLDEVYYISDRVVFLDSGKLVKDFMMDELSQELDYTVKLNLYIDDNHIQKALTLLRNSGYQIEYSQGNTISLKISSNKKVKPISELIDNGLRIVDFTVEGQNLDVY